MKGDAPLPVDDRRPLSELPDDPQVAGVLGRAAAAIGVVIFIGAIALSVWAAGG